jgi:hypothetical protein
VTEEGEKTKLPLGPTVTSTVVALAGLVYPISETVTATTSTKRQEYIFISANERRESAVNLPLAAISKK